MLIVGRNMDIIKEVENQLSEFFAMKEYGFNEADSRYENCSR